MLLLMLDVQNTSLQLGSTYQLSHGKTCQIFCRWFFEEFTKAVSSVNIRVTKEVLANTDKCLIMTVS